MTCISVVKGTSLCLYIYWCDLSDTWNKGQLLCTMSLCAGVCGVTHTPLIFTRHVVIMLLSSDFSLSVCMHAGQSDSQSHRSTFCVCLWVGIFWVCVSGDLSTIMWDYSVVLSLLWFSPAGWVAGWVFGFCLPTLFYRWPWCQPQTSSTHTESALDNTTSFWTAGWDRVQRDHPSTGGLVQLLF